MKHMETLLIIIGVIAIIAIGFALFYQGILAPEMFFALFHLLDCCATLSVFGITIVVTIGGFLLWHSLLMTALVGVSIMLIMLTALSVAAASYKAESQSS